MSDWPEWLLLAIKIAASLALLGVVGSLIITWMRRVQRDAEQMDSQMRAAGHVPPERDPERTDWIPVIRPGSVAERERDLLYGRHALAETRAADGYRGSHRKRWLSLRQLDASTFVEGRHHLAEVAT